MSKIIFLVLTMFYFSSFQFASGQAKKVSSKVVYSSKNTNKEKSSTANTKTKVIVFENKGDGQSKGTWGYDIYLNDKPYIHQTTIPSSRGKKGFNSKLKARKAGDLVIFKIKNGINPPSVTIPELDSIGVLE